MLVIKEEGVGGEGGGYESRVELSADGELCHTATGLCPGSKYKATVSALNCAGSSAWSAALPYATPPGIDPPVFISSCVKHDGG
jgi:hypothetical protein